jgi:putative transposase
MRTELALDALKMAIDLRNPGPGLIYHSDRGSQYASLDYRAELDRHGIVCSMSRKGDCWDNAVAESFFATLKGELIERECWPTKARARAAIIESLQIARPFILPLVPHTRAAANSCRTTSSR